MHTKSSNKRPKEAYYVEDALGLNMKMIYVEGGTFTMGASSRDSDADSDERPQHQVTLDSYYIAEFEVTQSQWHKIMGTTVYQQRDKVGYSGTFGVGDNYPMYYVSWNDADANFACRLVILLSVGVPLAASEIFV